MEMLRILDNIWSAIRFPRISQVLVILVCLSLFILFLPLFKSGFVEVSAIRGHSAIPFLISFLDSDELTSAVAARHLISFRLNSVDELVSTLDDEKNSENTRGRCAYCLSRIGEKSTKVLDSLKKASNADGEYARAESLRALWQLNHDHTEVLDGLIKLLSSSRTKVLFLVIATLGEMGPKAHLAIPMLRQIDKEQQSDHLNIKSTLALIGTET
jgi:hypothetical protein